MSVSLPNGVIMSLSKTFEAAKAVTAITNAVDPAITASAATLAAGDIVLLQSGWQKINDMPFKIGATNKLLNADTTDTELYPAGTGGGTVSKVTAWQQITQVMTLDSSGGDQQFATYSFLENDYESQIPTQQTPVTLTLGIADDDTLPGYQELKKASHEKKPRILKMHFPNGSDIYYYCYVALNETPSMTKGQVMAVSASFSLASRPQRYAKV